ncbi:energy-coupling factor ABC transporter ATP-binding protein [Streptococcus sciuri]|uniref:Energy-coupling factor ABC transporter ATP-binding protein n=1 Tax=Streptococcus sciuri TaxID=2973939 RepID=A0ABT2F7F5_9STRE|nr:energy-coupling factor ABC transporter ATP-binding protein [Streptococcus sciuri]MCS4487961.1 energy-coupling factor ABC transporter ATP-binding protein [Streptococcus sciuri]
MTDIIEVNNLSFRYDDQQEKYTLKDISFHVKQGEWLSIVGHNGSGKSTLVRLLDGLLVAQSGSIKIDGQLMSDKTVWDIRYKIGIVFQNPDNQFVGATVEDDVAFGLENKGVSLDDMRHRVSKALSVVGMKDFANSEPSRLSGGQKQRVAIAGAIAMQPKIIILDEATSMLDPKGRLELIRVIRAIRKKHEMTVISITHDLDEVAWSDRVLVLKEGQIESNMTPRELFSRHDLETIGLDKPFTTNVLLALKDSGISIEESYLTEDELEEWLWSFLLNM